MTIHGKLTWLPVHPPKPCKHFNGINHQCCKAGIDYRAVMICYFHPIGSYQGIPCFGGAYNRDGAVCFHYCEQDAEPTLDRAARLIMHVEDYLIRVLGGPACSIDANAAGVVDCVVCKTRQSLWYARDRHGLKFRCHQPNCVSNV